MPRLCLEWRGDNEGREARRLRGTLLSSQKSLEFVFGASLVVRGCLVCVGDPGDQKVSERQVPDHVSLKCRLAEVSSH